jgi:hypothetical protein
MSQIEPHLEELCRRWRRNALACTREAMRLKLVGDLRCAKAMKERASTYRICQLQLKDLIKQYGND